MAESALRGLVPRPQEIVAPTRSWNPLNPAFRDTVSSAMSNLLGSSNIAGREGYDRSRYADMLTGSVDFVPGVSEAAGVGDVRREVSQGNYPGAALAGVATALGVMPVIGDAAAKAVRGASQSATRSVRQVAEDAMKSIPGLKLGVYGNPENGYTISRIEIPKDLRNTGLGTSVMRSITQAADQEGARLMLTPTSDFGGDKNRLTEFYKRLGFINNSGRTRDFTTMEAMIRSPSVQSINSVDALDMSQAARMQRADEMAYRPETYYHASTSDIDEFKPKYDDGLTFITPNPEFANKWLGKGGSRSRLQEAKADSPFYKQYKAERQGIWDKYAAKYGDDIDKWPEAERESMWRETRNLTAQYDATDQVIYPLRTNVQNTFDPRQHGDVIAEFLQSKGRDPMASTISSGKTDLDYYKSGNYLLFETPEMVQFLKNKGFDSMRLAEDGYNNGAFDTLAVFDPANIRSVNAAFDPAKRNSANLMAGVGGADVGLSALNQLAPRNEERRPD